MTYDELSAEDKAVIDNFTNTMRGASGEAARLMNHLEAIQDDSNAIGIFQQLTGMIPNASGLAGADSMDKDEIQAVYTDFNSMTTVHNIQANREAWTKMAGIVNMIG